MRILHCTAVQLQLDVPGLSSSEAAPAALRHSAQILSTLHVAGDQRDSEVEGLGGLAGGEQ